MILGPQEKLHKRIYPKYSFINEMTLPSPIHVYPLAESKILALVDGYHIRGFVNTLSPR